MLSEIVKNFGKNLTERTDFLLKKGYRLKCCDKRRHLKKNCHESVKYEVCYSTEHVTDLHPDFARGGAVGCELVLHRNM